MTLYNPCLRHLLELEGELNISGESPFYIKITHIIVFLRLRTIINLTSPPDLKRGFASVPHIRYTFI
jgi:hypothetical protein